MIGKVAGLEGVHSRGSSGASHRKAQRQALQFGLVKQGRAADNTRLLSPRSHMSDITAINRRARQRAEEAGQLAGELCQKYWQLNNIPGITAQQLQHARRAAIAASINAAEALRCLVEQFDRSALIHQLAADAHDRVAAVACGHAERIMHTHAAERHRAAARRDSARAAQLKDMSTNQNRLTG